MELLPVVVQLFFHGLQWFNRAQKKIWGQEKAKRNGSPLPLRMKESSMWSKWPRIATLWHSVHSLSIRGFYSVFNFIDWFKLYSVKLNGGMLGWFDRLKIALQYSHQIESLSEKLCVQKLIFLWYLLQFEDQVVALASSTWSVG